MSNLLSFQNLFSEVCHSGASIRECRARGNRENEFAQLVRRQFASINGRLRTRTVARGTEWRVLVLSMMLTWTPHSVIGTRSISPFFTTWQPISFPTQNASSSACQTTPFFSPNGALSRENFKFKRKRGMSEHLLVFLSKIYLIHFSFVNSHRSSREKKRCNHRIPCQCHGVIRSNELQSYVHLNFVIRRN